MKKTNIFLASVMASGLFFASCQKEPQGELMRPDGSSNPDMIAFKQEMNAEMSSLEKSEGVKGIASMSNAFSSFSISLGKTSSKSSLQPLSDFLDKKILSKQGNFQKKVAFKNKAFACYDNFAAFLKENAKNSNSRNSSNNLLSEDFEQAQGVYRYNASTKEFDKVSSNSNGVLMLFPSDTNNMSVYDGEFYVSKLSTQKIMFDGEEMEVPNSFNMDLKVKSKSVAGLSFNVAYGNDFIPVKSAKINVFVLPLDFNLSFDYTPSLLTVDAALTNNETSTQLMAVNLNLDLYNDSLINSASGFVQVANLKAVYKITPPAGSLDNIDEDNFENLVKVELYNFPSNNYVGRLTSSSNGELEVETTTGPMSVAKFFEDLLN